MAQPIKGYEGSVKINANVTGNITTWQIKFEGDEKTVGPFIGDNTLYTYTSSTSLTGSLEATVPVGKDSGHTALISGAINGNTVPIELVTTAGYTISIPSGAISGFTMSQNASETVTISFDFRSSGAYTVV